MLMRGDSTVVLWAVVLAAWSAALKAYCWECDWAESWAAWRDEPPVAERVCRWDKHLAFPMAGRSAVLKVEQLADQKAGCWDLSKVWVSTEWKDGQSAV